ncbi:MAG TPA: hypothetical protein VFA33_18565 [Bryobacteraceae bacterium]|nr:hypothetical protein [Bryobacteraceae bacterium]
MKPLHVGLLVIAGALGGAVIMKMAQRPAAAPVTAPAPAPAAAPATAPAAAAPAPVAESAPSPFPEKEAEKKAAVRRHKAAPKPEPETVAQNQPPAGASAPPAQPTAPAAPAEPAKTPEPAPAEATPPPPPPPAPTVTLSAGTILSVRLIEGLSSDRNQPGDTFTGTLDAPLVADGFVIAERGARVEGRVVESEKAGRVKGLSSLGVVLTRLHTSDGQKVAIKTDTFTKQGQASHGTDAAKVGGGAALGAIIGAIAGGGKGAAIGAGVGGAAGAGDVVLTRGKPAVLPTETRIQFRLSEPITLTEQPRKS